MSADAGAQRDRRWQMTALWGGVAIALLLRTTTAGGCVGDCKGEGKVDVPDLARPHRAEAASCSVPNFGAATPFDVGDGTTPTSVAVGDFNGDGHLDLATANPGNGISILLGTGNGSFGEATPLDGGDSPNSVTVGDFNGDGHLDLVTDTGSILLGTGNGSFGAPTPFDAGGGGFVAIGDFNGDGHLDLAVTSTVVRSSPQYGRVAYGAVAILLGTGNGSFGAPTPFEVSDVPLSYPNSVAIGDFNGDGHPDIAVAMVFHTFGRPEVNGGAVAILLGTGSGSFGAATPFGEGPASLAVGDFNGDGHLDLATANPLDETVSILLGTGNGSFGAPTPVMFNGPTPTSVTVGDFNGDGHLDLAVAQTFGPSASGIVTILQGTGSGTFEALTFGALPWLVVGGGDPVFVTVGDFNGDGSPDLATANYLDNTVSVLLNSCGAPTGNACVDDCSGDGEVTVNEIITLVNIALGNADESTCPKGIPSGAAVTIALIVQAVNNALNGCAA